MTQERTGTQHVGRAPDTRLEPCWRALGVLYGKVLIPKILSGVQIERQLLFSPTNGNLAPKPSFSRDSNLGQIQGRDAEMGSLQPRCVCHEDP
jgi:hypothetical protein